MKHQQGFTLIETLIATFILTLTIGGLLQLAASGYYSVRYARNQLVADTLLQESLEFVHNSRDTNAQAGGDWDTWGSRFSSCIANSSTAGCIIDPYSNGAKIRACGNTCPSIVFFQNNGFYGYSGASYPQVNGQPVSGGIATSFIRSMVLTKPNPDQYVFTATVQWMNGSSLKRATQSVLITNWHN